MYSTKKVLFYFSELFYKGYELVSNEQCSVVCRYRGQLEQNTTDYSIVRGVKYWNTWTARLAFIIVFEVSQALLSVEHTQETTPTRSLLVPQASCAFLVTIATHKSITCFS